MPQSWMLMDISLKLIGNEASINQWFVAHCNKFHFVDYWNKTDHWLNLLNTKNGDQEC